MTIDYHVHLEEGPYSFRWLERTSQALEFFHSDDETEKGSKQQMTCHLQRLAQRVKNGCYSEEWLDLYLEQAKQILAYVRWVLSITYIVFKKHVPILSAI